MSTSKGRGKWKLVRDNYPETHRITNPAGLEYEFSESDLSNMDRRTLALLNDMLEGLIDLQNENEALRANGFKVDDDGLDSADSPQPINVR